MKNLKEAIEGVKNNAFITFGENKTCTVELMNPTFSKKGMISGRNYNTAKHVIHVIQAVLVTKVKIKVFKKVFIPYLYGEKDEVIETRKEVFETIYKK